MSRAAHKRRRSIPLLVKLQVALKALGYSVTEIQWDHDPPLALREWDPIAQDTVPPANDPDHIQILSIEKHRAKTTGRRGESKLSLSYNGDQSRIAKAARLNRETEEARRRMLAKGPGEAPPRKGSIQTRRRQPVPKQPKRCPDELARLEST